MQRHRKVSLLSATAISATAMIGSGWLFSAQLNARLAGNYAFLAWFLAALLVLAVGLCLAHVVAIYPVRGATTRSSSLSHNAIFGMPFAFANWFGLIISVPTEAQATTEYLSAYIKNEILMNNNGLTYNGKLFAMVILLFYLMVNFYGVRLLSKVNNTITALKIFTPLFAITLFLITRFDKSNFSLASNTIYNSGSAINAILGAGLIYSYNGFQLAAAFASEVKNPRKNIPLSMICSVLLIMFVYMALQFSFMGAVPKVFLSQGWAGLNFHSPLMNLALILGLNFLALLLTADSLVSPTGTGYAYLGASSRMFYAMAAEGQMPKWTISKLNPVYNICRRTLLINWVLVAIVLWNSQSWATLMLIVSGYYILGYMAAPISMGALKPKLRYFGACVFIPLSMILGTIPKHDLLIMNLSLVIVMSIYGTIQLTRKTSLKTLIILTGPFMMYLWLIYFDQRPLYVASVALLFYLFITTPSYVRFCKENATDKVSLEEEFIH
ncbi:MAG: APC family permease [Verrucomicrobiae bacterium]|nr:APC family permease [Verrucomicrobiae bacterium]